MVDTKDLHKQLFALLKGGQAHAGFDDVIKDFPAEKRGVKPAGLPYSGWQLLEHLRIAQHDILHYSKNVHGKYHSPKWPEGYWPKSPEPPSEKAWSDSIHHIKADAKEFEELIKDPKSNLSEPFPWADEGQNLLREALLIADHNAYHLGEIVALRRILGIWNS